MANTKINPNDPEALAAMKIAAGYPANSPIPMINQYKTPTHTPSGKKIHKYNITPKQMRELNMNLDDIIRREKKPSRLKRAAMWLKNNLGKIGGGVISGLVAGFASGGNPAVFIPAAMAGAQAGSKAQQAISGRDETGKKIEATGKAGGKGAAEGEFLRETPYAPWQLEELQRMAETGREHLEGRSFNALQNAIQRASERNERIAYGQPKEIGQIYQQIQQGYGQDFGSPYAQMLQERLARDTGEYSFEPTRERALKDLQSKILPSIAERFNLMGKGALTSPAFKAVQTEAANDLLERLAIQEEEAKQRNREFGQRQTEMLGNLVGQQQRFGLGRQGLQQELLRGEQGYGLQRAGTQQQYQQMLQNLLGQQQNYQLGKQQLGANLLGRATNPIYELGLLPQHQGLGESALKNTMKAILAIGGEVGKGYIQNKFMGGQQTQTPQVG